MKYKKRLSAMISAIAVIGVTAGSLAQAEECKPLHEIKTIKPGVLTVTSIVLPPFAFKDKSGKFDGIDAQVIDKFAKDNCLTVNHVVTDSAAAIQYVVAGRADVSVGAWYRTSERAKAMGLTGPVYLEQTAIYSRDGADKFDQLKDRKVGTVQGYLWVPELKEMYGSNLSLYPNAVALAQDISTGRIDAAVNTYAIGNEAQKQGGLAKDVQIKVATADERVKSSVYPAQTGYIYNKGNPELGSALDATIKDFQQSGKLGTVLTQYGLEATAANVGEPRYADQ